MTAISERAQQILDEVEREARARRSAGWNDDPAASRGLARLPTADAAPALRPVAPASPRPAPGAVALSALEAAGVGPAPTVTHAAAEPVAPPAAAPVFALPAEPVGGLDSPEGVDAGRLLALVDAVTAQTEQAKRRLENLTRAIDDIAGELGIDVDRQSAMPGQPGAVAATEPTPMPAAALPPTAPPVRVTEPASPAGLGPRVPVEEQAAALQALLAQRPSSTPAPVAAPVPPRPAPVAAAPAEHAPPARVPGASNVSPLHPAAPEDRRPESSSVVSDSARLVAVEMAVTGATRAEVGERLRSLYGIANPEPTLDEVFGRGTTGSTRVPH